MHGGRDPGVKRVAAGMHRTRLVHCFSGVDSRRDLNRQQALVCTRPRRIRQRRFCRKAWLTGRHSDVGTDFAVVNEASRATVEGRDLQVLPRKPRRRRACWHLDYRAAAASAARDIREINFSSTIRARVGAELAPLRARSASTSAR